MLRVEHNNPTSDQDLLMVRANELGEDLLEMELIDTQEAYRALRERRQAAKRELLVTGIMRYAAMLTLPLFLGCGVLFYLLFRQSQSPETMAHVYALDGSVVRYELPDGSVAWLNAGSSLRYPTRFSKTVRSVELEGEAYFEVSASKEHPFEVHTPAGLKVHVHGTCFNVSAYGDSPKTETSLAEGKVCITLPNSDTPVELLPGEHLIYDNVEKTVDRSRVDVDEKIAWKEGELIFRNAGIEEIFQRLERRFNVEITYRNHRHKDYRYRATFRNESLTQILEYLAKTASMKWHIDNITTASKNSNKNKHVTVDLY